MGAETIGACAQIDGEFDLQFGGTGEPLSERARHHLGNCERCRKLYHWMQELAVDTGDLPQLQLRIRNALQGSLRSVAPIPSSRVLVLRLAAGVLLSAVTVASLQQVAGLRQMSLVQLVTIAAFMIAGAVLLCRSIAGQMVPGSLHRYSPGTMVIILAAGFPLITAILFPFREPEAFADRGWHCLAAGLIMAIPASLVFWFLVRRGAVLGIGAMGGSLGAAAGLTSVAVLQATCPYQDLAHLLVWHGSVLVTASIAGAGIGHVIQLLHRKTRWS